jgi:hypothetical protein
MPECDPGLAQIIGRHLHVDTVANADADEILAHFTRNMGEYFVAVRQGNSEHGAGQNLGNGTCQLNWFFFGHWSMTPKKIYFCSRMTACVLTNAGPENCRFCPAKSRTILQEVSCADFRNQDLCLEMTKIDIIWRPKAGIEWPRVEWTDGSIFEKIPSNQAA